MNKTVKILCGVGGGLLLVGFVLAILCFSFLGFDYKRLDGGKNYEQKIEQYNPSSVKIIETDLSNKKVIVRPSSKNEITVTYYSAEHDTFTCSQTGERLFLKNNVFENWLDQLKNGILNGFAAIGMQEVLIDVPASYIGDLCIDTSNASVTIEKLDQVKVIEIDNSNGSIDLRDLKCDTLDLKTSNSGIELENITVANRITGKSSNGKIDFTQVNAQDIDLKTSNATIDLANTLGKNKLYAQSSNGKIVIDEVDSNDIYFKTSNSSVKGSLAGKQEEYTIKSDTSNGSNNLPEHWGSGAKKLSVDTSNGSIDIEFAQ